MKIRIATLAACFAMATPAVAQNDGSPEGKALHAYTNCVEAGAAKYAVLDQPLSDIAEAAMASCEEAFMAFNAALAANVNANHRQPMVNFAMANARAKAMVVAAEAKLAAR